MWIKTMGLVDDNAASLRGTKQSLYMYLRLSFAEIASFLRNDRKVNNK
ncbi:hypothetical protein C8P68_102237 [Mucilaginibacter yixingensis]|uniref:Uncharacterized protein n=1 Tax=Mucilaginibacter yixingensis TaxID=1295612 RepID=A0A2T5JCC1_9SPHI|nr:hypothetical protein C8P68_102237 [Mucilaginibacter yixingensis]